MILKEAGAFAVQAQDVRKRYGKAEVLRGATFAVPHGSIFGFIGPNGAGKTTTIKAILGLVSVEGELTVFGRQAGKDRLKLANHIGAVIGSAGSYLNLTGRENLQVAAKYKSLPADEIDWALGMAGLVGEAEKRVAHYSSGMRQRLAIAGALLGRPDLLVLDEPTNGLDQEGMADLKLLLRNLRAEGATIFISSHLLSELDDLVDHLALMRRGEVLACGPTAEIFNSRAEEIVVTGPSVNLVLHCAEVGGFTVVDTGPDVVRLLAKEGAAVQEAMGELVRCTVSRGGTIYEIRQDLPTILDTYRASET